MQFLKHNIMQSLGHYKTLIVWKNDKHAYKSYYSKNKKKENFT